VGSIIKLNVGGEKFATTKTTLTQHDGSMLATMFSGCYELALDDKGHVFIDRDGHLFRHVLAFLREGADWVLPEDATTLRRLHKEFSFYGLNCIGLPPPNFELDLRKTPTDPSMYHGETVLLGRGYEMVVQESFFLARVKVMLRCNEKDVKIVLRNQKREKIIESTVRHSNEEWFEGPINQVLTASSTYYIFISKFGPVQYAFQNGDYNFRKVGKYLSVKSKGCQGNAESFHDNTYSLAIVLTCKNI